MTQLIASNQLTLTNIIDGKTPYVHWAYSGNADGTGLTFIDNGQRYIGNYSDYTQADSTDKTKYRWADRWAKIDVGGTNYFSQSLSNYNTDGLYAYRVLPKDTITISVSDNDANQDITSCYIGLTKKGYDASGGFYWIVDRGLLKTDKITLNGFAYLSVFPKTQDTINKLFNRYNIKVETGTVATDWTPTPEDIQANIDSKADQTLTQQQLNALNEQRGIYEAELQARATASELEEWINAYNNYVKANDQNKKEAEASLISTSIRVADVEKVLGAMKERWDFILNYMDVSEDGLFFGKKDGSAEVRVYGDRISMFMAGNEVMYISQDTININNGIFSTSIQIGRFKEEQYGLNPDINIIRYVG